MNTDAVSGRLSFKGFLSELLQNIKDLWSLIVGLGITGRYTFQRRVTVHYPRKTIDAGVLASYRGPLELVGKENEPAATRCIICMMCANACPSRCISITKAPPPQLSEAQKAEMEAARARGEKVKMPKAPKRPVKWDYDFSLCSLCGTCVEVCPAGAIRFSNDMYMVGRHRDDFKLDLLGRLKDAASGEDL